MDMKNYLAKGAPRKTVMKLDKDCQVCGKPISIDDTPRNLFYSGFCSDKCKSKYIEGDF